MISTGSDDKRRRYFTRLREADVYQEKPVGDAPQVDAVRRLVEMSQSSDV